MGRISQSIDGICKLVGQPGRVGASTTGNPISIQLDGKLQELESQLVDIHLFPQEWTSVHSVGKGRGAAVVWIDFLPPGQTAQDGIYVSLCFGKTGNGLVAGGSISNTSKEKYKHIATVQRPNPLIDVDGTGNFAAIGVLMVSQGAEPGERILYSRDSDGNVQAVLKLLGDGSFEGISPGGYKLETEKDFELKTDGDIKVEASGDVGIKGTNVKIEGQVEATGGTFKCKGTAAPTGTGCLCALSVCPVTGAPHVGDTASGT